MRCLFVTSLLPTPDPATGFEIANRAIADAYRAAGAELVFVGFRREGQRTSETDVIDLGEIVIENAAAGSARKVGWLVGALAARLPAAAAKLKRIAERELLARIEARGPFDAVILNSVQMPAAFPGLLDVAPAIFVAHNVEHSSARENAANAKRRMRRLLYAREARLLQRIEERLSTRAAAIHVLACEDAAALGVGADDRVHLLPVTVGHPPAEDDGVRHFDVGLIGTWSWAPNRAGLDWFLDHVAPRLPAGLTVGVAGRLDGRRDVPAGVTMLGRVPYADRFVSACRVLALATTAGTGVQLKTIEALEAGMPAVATSRALRGLGSDLPGTVRVADDASAFAAALVASVEAERAGALPRGDGQAFLLARREQARQAASRALQTARQGREMHPAAGTALRIGPVMIAAVEEDAALATCLTAIEGSSLTRLAFANAHCVNVARRDPDYADALADFLVLSDGVGVDIAARLLHGAPFPANLNGTDFVPKLLQSLPPCRVALVGGREGVADRAATALSRLAPRHAFRAVSHGFFHGSHETAAVLRDLEAFRADVVLVALGVPAQELFIARHLTAGHARLAIGVGALFDFLAGEVPRAPAALRRIRLEWAYRLAREPRRLAARYIAGNPAFLLDVLRQKLRP